MWAFYFARKLFFIVEGKTCIEEKERNENVSFLRKKHKLQEPNLAGKLVRVSALVSTQNKRYFIATLGELAEADSQVGSQVSIIVQVRNRVKLDMWE